MLLVWGCFSVSKTIIPDAHEHFLTHSTRRHTYLLGGLGFRQQKQIEERQVKLALAGMGLQLHAAHVRREESPGFILPLGGRRIGIEHTEFFFPEEETGAPRGFQNLRYEAVEMARRNFRANGGPPL